MKYRALLAAVAVLGMAVCIPPLQARERSVSDIIKHRTLIGKVITVRSCIVVPMRADTDQSEEFVALYPCDHAVDDSLTEVIFGKIDSDQVAQPFADANISFEGRVEATFTGRLAERPVEKGDTTEYLVLTIEKVSNPIETPDSE